jgi:hypothetical protein
MVSTILSSIAFSAKSRNVQFPKPFEGGPKPSAMTFACCSPLRRGFRGGWAGRIPCNAISKSFGDQSLASVLDGWSAATQGIGNLLIRPGGTNHIGLQ